MQRRDRAKLASMLENQGGKVRRTRSGFLATHPSTRSTVSWHASPTGDTRRGTKNLRADVVGAGFSWPISA